MVRTMTVATFVLVMMAGVPGQGFAQAQPRTELGASLVSSVVALEDESIYNLGVPAAGFGLLGQGVYLSLFLTDRFAVEPQLGFMWNSFGDDSEHILNVSGQFTYFTQGLARRSPYVFGTVGIVDASNDDYTPKSFGAGAGYRIPLGDRLVLRIDGRYTRFTGEFSGQELDTVAIGLSIGGVFGLR